MAMARRIAGVAVLVVVFVLAASGCKAFDFNVGGNGVWAPNPAEPFNRWAERTRFQVNDRLVFRYRKEEDSVAVVSQSHYDACNATEPLQRLDGGDSVFVFNHSGPFFFISGDARRCQAGERLIVVVLAVRSNTPSPPTSPTPPSPPVPAPSPHSMPPPPPAPGTNGTTASPPVVPALAPCSPPPSPAVENSTAPAPGTANATASPPPPPPPSSASALRGGTLLLLLVIVGAMSFV
ncbi:hypothetical protein GUJ93_ZPchr0001g30915 [Zizania palustris]|uniref:Phytocyanin domain-containing protein n=1 Tax=Zizania palustris TaxID=103762 RepID=A0A8J5VSN9_ZIZPA|nr:hypothetical protein GUJ93_ZPchr0001g30915 [Zizania palustris]